MVLSADAEYMRRALELASKARGQTSPNPMVGALLVKAGKIIAEGYHHRAGEDHAEIITLKKARSVARGSTLYVTLEPCCHTGKTGPCVNAIIDAGVKRVVFGAVDPDPRINGKGAKILRRAGVAVTRGVLAQDAVKLNEAFHHFHTTGRPFVTLKLAQSLDGRIATSTGDSKWITGKLARRFAHELRAESDAVVVGAGTVRTDDPALTVRLVKGKNPYRIVLSSTISFPPKSQLMRNTDYRTIIASSRAAITRFAATSAGKNVMFWEVKKESSGKLDLRDVLKKCRSFGLRSILVEGGAAVATSFLKAGLVDKVVAITAPTIIGAGLDSIGDLGIRKIGDAVRFSEYEVLHLGDDRAFIGYVKKGKR